MKEDEDYYVLLLQLSFTIWRKGIVLKGTNAIYCNDLSQNHNQKKIANGLICSNRPCYGMESMVEIRDVNVASDTYTVYTAK